MRQAGIRGGRKAGIRGLGLRPSETHRGGCTGAVQRQCSAVNSVPILLVRGYAYTWSAATLAMVARAVSSTPRPPRAPVDETRAAAAAASEEKEEEEEEEEAAAAADAVTLAPAAAPVAAEEEEDGNDPRAAMISPSPSACSNWS